MKKKKLTKACIVHRKAKNFEVWREEERLHAERRDFYLKATGFKSWDDYYQASSIQRVINRALASLGCYK